MRITPQVDAVVKRYYTDVVGEYWPPTGATSRTLPEPSLSVQGIGGPEFEMTAIWTLDDLYVSRYLVRVPSISEGTWRAPAVVVASGAGRGMGAYRCGRVAWPLFLRLGRCA